MKKLMKARQLAALMLTATLYSCAHPGPVLAAEYGDKAVTISRVYDGDSMTASIPNWPGIIGSAIPVRVNGIDTPELYGKCADGLIKADLARPYFGGTKTSWCVNP